MPKQLKFLDLLTQTLEENHAKEIIILDVRNQTTITDYMIICSGRSSRHVKSIAELTTEKMKTLGLSSLRQQGLEGGDWALVDFGDFVLHVMQPESRAFYDLEGLWNLNMAKPLGQREV